MLTLPKEKKAPPSLRTLEDLSKTIDLEKVLDLAKLYELGIDDSHDEHIARMGVFHPSAAGTCRRREVLSFTYVQPTDRVSKKMKAIFEIGHAIHDLVQTRLEGLGPRLVRYGLQYEFQREVPYDPETDQLFLELSIGGTTDGLLRIWNAVFEQRGVVEIKSQSHDKHEEMAKEALKTGKALKPHLMQSHIYAWRFKLPLIWVFYYNKNNSKWQAIPHLFETQIFDDAIVWFAECLDYATRGELPPRDEAWFLCKECPYRTLCKPKILQQRNRLPSLPTLKLRRGA